MWLTTNGMYRGVHPPKPMMHIAYSPYFHKLYKFHLFQFFLINFPYFCRIYKFPHYFCKIDVLLLTQVIYFFAPPILTKLYIYWMPLGIGMCVCVCVCYHRLKTTSIACYRYALDYFI